MTPTEKRVTGSLAIIYALRMFGLFLIMPVFALYAEQLENITPILIGLAIGIYGLTQALLQIPFGMLSDRIGRKPVIVTGLFLFAIGSVIAATAETIWWIILGRALQGAGAIAAAIMALLADLTSENSRTKAMAGIGMSIGLAFMLALVAGPVLYQHISVPGLFWLTAFLSVIGILLILFAVPTSTGHHLHRDAEVEGARFISVLKDRELLRLDMGIFVLHLIMTALFLTYPLLLRDTGAVNVENHWKVYLIVLSVSILLMIPFILIAEKYNKTKPVFITAIAAIGLSLLGIAQFGVSLWTLVVWLMLFFTAFNLLESILPSLISKMAPAASKGTAMGIYSTFQFSGAFVGGVIGGVIHQSLGLTAVLIVCAIIVVLWFLAALGMTTPERLSQRLVKLDERRTNNGEFVKQLSALPGVKEAVIASDEGVAYLKVYTDRFDSEKLEDLLTTA